MEWIRVKDRLPEEPGRYLVMIYADIEIKYYDHSYKDDWTANVTHWMPLPKKPWEES